MLCVLYSYVPYCTCSILTRKYKTALRFWLVFLLFVYADVAKITNCRGFIICTRLELAIALWSCCSSVASSGACCSCIRMWNSDFTSVHHWCKIWSHKSDTQFVNANYLCRYESQDNKNSNEYEYCTQNSYEYCTQEESFPCEKEEAEGRSSVLLRAHTRLRLKEQRLQRDESRLISRSCTKSVCTVRVYCRLAPRAHILKEAISKRQRVERKRERERERERAECSCWRQSISVSLLYGYVFILYEYIFEDYLSGCLVAS